MLGFVVNNKNVAQLYNKSSRAVLKLSVHVDRGALDALFVCLWRYAMISLCLVEASVFQGLPVAKQAILKPRAGNSAVGTTDEVPCGFMCCKDDGLWLMRSWLLIAGRAHGRWPGCYVRKILPTAFGEWYVYKIYKYRNL